MDSQITRDTLFNGRLICCQNKNGYRFSIDPVLLAHFSRVKNNAAVLDLGAGCGIISLIIAYRNPEKNLKISALEIQDSLFTLLKQNIRLNNYDEIISPTAGDLRKICDFFKAESFDQVFCNPPFYKIGSGRKNCGQEALQARHQVFANLAQVVEAARKVMKNKGVLSLVYPAAEFIYLVEILSKNRLEAKKIRLVYSYPESSQASLVLVEAVKNGGTGCTMLPPLFVYNRKKGGYTDEINEFYS